MTPAVARHRAEVRAHLAYAVALAASGRNPHAQAAFDATFVDIIGHSLCDVGALAERILSAAE